MRFNCQNSGKCCTHPNIVVTLTHEDIFRLMGYTKDFDTLLTKVQFLVEPPNVSTENFSNKKVVHLLKTTTGDGVFILRRTKLKKCIFFDNDSNMCTIHSFRPQACRNFPFSFSSKIKNEDISISYVKNATKFCPGIGIGVDYSSSKLLNIGYKTIDTINEFNGIIKELNIEANKNNPLTPKEALYMIYLVAEKRQDDFKEDLEIL